MQKVLMLSGRKQSGKTSAMNYLSGYIFLKNNVFKHYKLDKDGNLLVDIKVENPETKVVSNELGVMDLNRKDEGYVNQAKRFIWPYVKPYNFGDALKEIGASIFQLDITCLYGTDEQKNQLTHLKWEDFAKLTGTKKTGLMTYREFMEEFGTKICRKLYNDCWVSCTAMQIVGDNYPLSIICDCRAENEIDYIRSINGLDVKVVRLLRDPFNSQHEIETGLDNYNGFDAVIDNTNMSKEQKGNELIKLLQGWGWIN